MQNQLNGSGGRRQALSSIDFYRRVPRDLTEATTLGAFMSVICLSVMGLLFLCETWAFARSRIVTSIMVDENTQPQIRLNFNVTLFDLHCDYVSVDVWDALGTNRQNVTKNIDKWQLDEAGVKRIFSGRNRETRQLLHDDGAAIDVVGDGHALQLTSENFASFLQENEMAFVDLYAPWCVWCQRLAPTWEAFAAKVKEDGMPIGIGKVDCMAEAQLCREVKVLAFPTLRWYHSGEPVTPDYKMDRTLDALVGFAKRKLDMDEKFKEWDKKTDANPDERERKRKLYQQHRPEHQGCLVTGHLMVNRVPGNFHIEASSKNHNLNAAMTNLSHSVNHLSFGEPLDKSKRATWRILKQIPETHQQFQPMDEQVYITKDYHQAFHHYIKVVSTHMLNKLMTYQFLEQSQIVFYDEVNVPEARFSYDLSPMSVVVTKTGRKWYDYLTSLCAIIGGTFTTLGLIDATLYKILKPKKL